MAIDKTKYLKVRDNITKEMKWRVEVVGGENF